MSENVEYCHFRFFFFNSRGGQFFKEYTSQFLAFNVSSVLITAYLKFSFKNAVLILKCISKIDLWWLLSTSAPIPTHPKNILQQAPSTHPLETPHLPSPMTFWSHVHAWSRDKLESLCSPNLQDGDLGWGLLINQLTWLFDHLVTWGHLTN